MTTVPTVLSTIPLSVSSAAFSSNVTIPTFSVTSSSYVPTTGAFSSHVPLNSTTGAFSGHVPLTSTTGAFSGHVPLTSTTDAFSGHVPLNSTTGAFSGHVPLNSTTGAFSGHVPLTSTTGAFSGHVPLNSTTGGFSGHVLLSTSASVTFSGCLPPSSNVTFSSHVPLASTTGAAFSGHVPLSLTCSFSTLPPSNVNVTYSHTPLLDTMPVPIHAQAIKQCQQVLASLEADDQLDIISELFLSYLKQHMLLLPRDFLKLVVSAINQLHQSKRGNVVYLLTKALGIRLVLMDLILCFLLQGCQWDC